MNIYEIVVGSVSCKFQYNHYEPYRHWSQHGDWHVLSIVDVALHILTAEATTTVFCQKSMQSCYNTYFASSHYLNQSWFIENNPYGEIEFEPYDIISN